MTDVAACYIAFLAIGAGGLAPAHAGLGGRLATGGALFARPLALACAAMFAWLVAVMTPLPYGTPLAIGACAAPWLWSGVLCARDRSLPRRIIGRWRVLLAGEVCYVAIFALTLWMRSHAPESEWPERPLQLALLGAARSADAMPLPDPWFAGVGLAYYHVTFVMLDIPARLAGLAPGVALNVAGAAAIAMIAPAFGGLAADIAALERPRRAFIAGALGAAVTGLATFPAYAFDVGRAAAGAAGPLAHWSLTTPFPPHEEVAAHHWWGWQVLASGLPEAIVQPPVFSLASGDAHPHVLALPLMAAACAIALLECVAPQPWRRQPARLLLAAFVLAALAMMHPWYVPPCLLLWVGAGLLVRGGDLRAVAAAIARATAPAVLGLVLAFPALTLLDGARRLPVGQARAMSNPIELAGVWGGVWIVAGLGLVACTARMPGGARAAAWLCWVTGVALGPAFLVEGPRAALATWGADGLAGAALAGLCAVVFSTAARNLRTRGRVAPASWAGLVAAAAVIAFLVEVFMVGGYYAGGRVNTVFKFSYPAWAWAAAACAAACVLHGPALARRGRAARIAGIGIAAVWLGCLAWLPAAAATISTAGHQRALDASGRLADWSPGLAAAAVWARANLDPDRHVVAESPTPRFWNMPAIERALSTHGGAISLMGDPHFARTWRGVAAEVAIAPRLAALDALYREGDPARVRAAGVTHVLVGPAERSRYGPDVALRFRGWPVAFRAPGVVILDVPRVTQR